MSYQTPDGIGRTQELQSGLVGGTARNAQEPGALPQKKERRKRGPNKKPGANRNQGRSTASMAPAEAQAFNAHQKDDPANPGRLMPNVGNDRIPIGQQTNLSNVETYISDSCVGYWFLQERIDGAIAGGYGFVKDHRGESIKRTKGNSQLTLMQIDRKLWEQDQEAKKYRAVDAMAQASRIDTNKGEYGDDQSGHSVSVRSVENPLFD